MNFSHTKKDELEKRDCGRTIRETKRMFVTASSKTSTVVLIKLFLALGYSFLTDSVYSQAKSKKGVDSFYNAYRISKEIVAKGRAIEKSPSDFSIQDRERFLGYLIWYADAQDYGDSSKAKLDKVLKKYKKLNDLYTKIYSSISTNDYLYNIDTIEFAREFVAKIPLQNSYGDTLLNAIRKYAILKKDSANLVNKIKILENDSANLEAAFKFEDSVYNAKVNQKEIKEKGDTSGLNLLSDELDKSMSIRDRLREMLDRSKLKLEADRNKLKSEKFISNLNIVRKKIDAAFESDIEQKRLVVQKIQNLKGNGQIDKLWMSDAAIQQQVKEIQNAHEFVLSEAQNSTFQFRLPSQTEMIDAIAIYLAKRVKQESVMWFFESIKKNAENYELIKTFFPATLALLQSNEVYEIPNLGTQWRYALSKDFLKMPRNVIASDWITKRWFPNPTANDKLIFEYINAGFDISDLLLQRYSYRDLVRQMYLQTSSNTSILEQGIWPKNIFALLYGINEECFLLSPVDSTYRLLQYEDLRLMNKDEIEIMISLIDMKYGESFSMLCSSKDDVFEIKSNEIESIRQWLGSIEIGVQHFKKIQKDFNQAQEDVKNGKRQDAVYSVFNLWESVNTLFDLVIPDEKYRPIWMKKLSEQSNMVKQFTKKGFEVYNQISLRNYAGAVNTMLVILEDLFYNKDSIFRIKTATLKDNLTYVKKNSNSDLYYPHYLDKITKSGSGVNGDSTWLRRDTIYAAVIFERERHAIQLIRKLSGFLNDVMLTTDPKKLAKVVESYALPPGSYKRKRNSWWSLDLNAHVGVYGGYEIARRNKTTAAVTADSKGWVYGVTAPIGLSLSRTFGKKIEPGTRINDVYIRNPDKLRVKRKNVFVRGNSTFTLSVNIIDIGAVVSYRFNNTIDSILPQQVRWEQVISPGIHLSYGIKNTPLAISAGYQYTPLLRRVGEAQGNDDASQYNASRVQLGLLFDLPVANVWQLSFYRPKLKKR